MNNVFEDLGFIVHMLLLIAGGVTIIFGFIATILALTYGQGYVAGVLFLTTLGLLMVVIRVTGNI